MDAQQLAIIQQQLATQQLQLLVTSLAILAGPVTGVLIGYWLNNRKEARATQHKLFLTLMAGRKAIVRSASVVEALNTIDVVFAKNPKIVGVWHEYYKLLQDKNLPNEPLHHKWLELLSAIGEHLGYENLSQVDLDKFYQTNYFVDQHIFREAVAKELLRVLSATARFEVAQKPPGDATDPPKQG